MSFCRLTASEAINIAISLTEMAHLDKKCSCIGPSSGPRESKVDGEYYEMVCDVCETGWLIAWRM